MATSESITPEAPVVTTASTSTAPIPSGAVVPPEGGFIGVVLPFVFIFVVFYFLMIRPQQKKFKTHQAMISAVRRGDKVVTSGGIVGKVTKVDTDDNILHVEIAEDVVIKVIATTLSSVEAAEKPVNDNAKDKKKK